MKSACTYELFLILWLVVSLDVQKHYDKNLIHNTTIYLKKYVHQIFIKSGISFHVSPMIDFIDISIIGNQYTSPNCKHSIIVDLAVARHC